jgi:hypothetical protein
VQVRAVSLLLCALLATPAFAAPGPRERIQRVRKGRAAEQLHLYWASPMSDTDVLVTPFLEKIAPDAEFDVVDQRGYVGRARVRHVEIINAGCPQLTFSNATARVDRSGTISNTMMVAMPPSSRDLSRARVLLPDELRGDVPEAVNDGGRNRFIDVAVDLDGDNRADLVRAGYDCPPTGTAPYSYAYCVETYARPRGGAWRLLETVTVPECY